MASDIYVTFGGDTAGLEASAAANPARRLGERNASDAWESLAGAMRA